MSDYILSNLRNYRCSKGHQWTHDSLDYNTVRSFSFPGGPAYCTWCIEEYCQQHFGVVEEITTDQPVVSKIPIYGDSVQEDGA